MNELFADEVERRIGNLRNLITEWDPLGRADVAPRAYNDLVVELWARLMNGASRAEISQFLWSQTEDRYGHVPNPGRIDEVADEIAERVKAWNQGAAGIDEAERLRALPAQRLATADDADHPKVAWAAELPGSQPAKVRNASLADLPPEHEGFQEYEASADPDRMREEEAQRRFRGQYLRRLRRLRERDRHAH